MKVTDVNNLNLNLVEKLAMAFSCVLLFFVLVSCQGTGAGPLSSVSIEIPEDGPEAEIEPILSAGLAPENVGFILYDMESAEIVLMHNRNAGFIPASTAKIPSMITALDRLGPDYRFETILAMTGRVENGILKGDVYLKGGGDPVLDYGDLIALADALRRNGIFHVDGNFYYDETSLPSFDAIDAVMETDGSYNTGISALNLDFNTVQASWSTGRGNSTVYITPDLPMFRITAQETSPLENQEIFFSGNGDRGSDEAEHWGLSLEAAGRSGRKQIPVKDPALFVAQAFRAISVMHGVNIPEPGKGMLTDHHTVLYTHKSPELIHIASSVLTYSNNASAELLLLTAFQEKRPESLHGAGQALVDHFRQAMPAVDWEGFDMRNASGLSSSTRISPEQMLAILLYADQRSYQGRYFPSLLPTSGGAWSLRNRLATPGHSLRVWAKTGMINYGIGLAGYLHTDSGRKMAFVFFISDTEKRRSYEVNSQRRTRQVSQEVSRWRGAARHYMDSEIIRWIENF